MKRKQNNDAAFNHLMECMVSDTTHAGVLAEEMAGERNQPLLDLYRCFAAPPAGTWTPGQIVQWKPGMKNKRLPEYGEPVIVLEVLNPPVYDESDDKIGSNLFHEPLSLVLGLQDSDGDFMAFHYDGRRFDVVTDTEDKP